MVENSVQNIREYKFKTNNYMYLQILDHDVHPSATSYEYS